MALFSGGLDSSLAILLLLRQKIEVTALSFLTHFGCDLSDRSSCGHNPYPVAEKFGFTVKLVHLGMEYVEIVKNPRFGRGKNMNVCVDCRLIMLAKAKEYMELTGADFIITGEVLGQRPMSQRREMLRLIDNKCGLAGRLLRPLSAKLLPPTRPEIEGLVNREQLEAIQGRSRLRQIQLAKEFGLTHYPAPAAGCLLTDIGYSNRLRDLLAHNANPQFDDLNLLRVGRHFRLSNKCKLLVGRNEIENKIIQQSAQNNHWLLEAKNTGSPIGLLQGAIEDGELNTAARITARYCDLKNQRTVAITITQADREMILSVAPLEDEHLIRFRL